MNQDIAIFVKQLTLTSELPLRYLGDPILRFKCKPVPFSRISSKEIKKFSNQLKKSLIKYRKITGVGRGLAANQIGGKVRICVVWPFTKEKPEVWINPQIIWSSKEKALYHESCMSAVCLGIDVVRPYLVKVSYFDLSGNKHEEKLDPSKSRLIQHEIDHLDGIVCLDRGINKSATVILNSKAKIFANKFKLQKIN